MTKSINRGEEEKIPTETDDKKALEHFIKVMVKLAIKYADIIDPEELSGQA